MTNGIIIKKWLRIGFKATCIVAVVFVLFVFTLIALLRIETVRNQLLTFTSNQIEQRTGWHLQAESITDLSAFHWKLSGVRIQHLNDTPVTIRSLEIEFSPYRLALGKAVFKEVVADGIWVSDPVLLSQMLTDSDPTMLACGLPSLSLLSIEVTHLNLQGLHIQSDTVLGKVAFNIEGELEVSPLRKFITADLVISDASERGDPTFISLQAYRHGDQLTLESRLVEPRDGILNTLTDGTDPLAFNLECDLVTSWQGIGHWLSIGLAPNLQGHFSLETDGLPLAIESPLLNFLQDNLTLKGTYQWVPGSSLNLDAIQATSRTDKGLIQLDGHIHFDSQFAIAQSEFHGTVEDVAMLEQITKLPLSGRLDFHAELSGDLTVPIIAIELASDVLHLREFSLHHPRLQLNGVAGGEHLRLDTILWAEIGILEASASTTIDWDYSDRVSFKDTRFHLPHASLHGDVMLSLIDHSVTGQLDGHVTDLSVWSSLIGQDLKGHADLLVVLKKNATASDQQIDITATAAQVQLGQAFKGAVVTAHIYASDLFSIPQGTITLTGQELTFADAYFKELTAETSFGKQSEKPPLRINARGTWRGDFTLATQARYFDDSTRHGVAIETLKGTWGDQTFSLIEPVELMLNASGAELVSFHLQFGKGLLERRGQIGFEEVYIALQAKNIPNERIHMLVAESPKTGTLSGDILLTGPKNNPHAKLQLSWSDLANPAGLPNLPPVSASLTGDLKEGRLEIIGEAKGIGTSPFNFNANIPVAISLDSGLSVNIDRQQPISISLQASGEISPIIELLPDPPTLTGQATITLHIEGSLDKPAVMGSMTLHNATFEAVGSGLVLRNLNAEIEGTGNSIVLKALSGDDGDGGRVTGTGLVHLNPEQHYPFDISLAVQHTVLLRREFVKGIASGELHFKGDADHPMLTGSLTADEVAVQIPKQKPISVANVDVKYVNTPPDRLSQKTVPATSVPLPLDISLVIPGNFYVNGTDLDSEWRGTVNISGDSETPLINGELILSRGDFRVNGKQLNLEKGRINFGGELEKATTIYVLASQDIDRVTVEAILKGPIKAPKLSFRSSPAMSQREILSYLILNHGLTDDNPFEADQMSDEALDLPTSGNGDDQPSMLSRLRRIGIDRIDIDNKQEGDQNNMSVKVGKYLSKGLFVGVKRGITDESNRFSVEADIIRNVKLQAEVQDDASSKMLLMWKHDY